MIGRRKSPDGLPFRLYLRKGKFKTSVGYKLANGTWSFRLTAPTNNPEAVAKVLKEGIERANALNGKHVGPNSVEALFKKYFAWQSALPESSESKKTKGTLAENQVEARRLIAVFGAMEPADIRPVDVYGYLAAREAGGAPMKANKEIALLSAVLEYGRRLGLLETNPCRGIKYNKGKPNQKYVPEADLAFATAVARERKGSYLVLALCLNAAYLTVSRPDETRALARQNITELGIRMSVGKRKAGHMQRTKLIEWSPTLKAIIDEALALQRVAGMYVFANSSGQVYTTSGFNTILTRLMVHCETKAKETGASFTRFTLRDMRPAAVTDRMEEGDQQITNASGHTDDRMVRKVYDRRKTKVARSTK